MSVTSQDKEIQFSCFISVICLETATTLYPLFIKQIHSSCPTPLDAPVTNHVFILFLSILFFAGKFLLGIFLRIHEV
jgi:hypothetical protein